MAREQGLTEEQVAQIDDGYAASLLGAGDIAALQLTDAIIGDPRSLTAAQRELLLAAFSPAQIAELGLGIGLFLALSKVLITLGLEPETMPTTVLPTPGTR